MLGYHGWPSGAAVSFLAGGQCISSAMWKPMSDAKELDRCDQPNAAPPEWPAYTRLENAESSDSQLAIPFGAAAAS